MVGRLKVLVDLGKALDAACLEFHECNKIIWFIPPWSDKSASAHIKILAAPQPR